MLKRIRERRDIAEEHCANLRRLIAELEELLD
jgi:hypothetical protein